MAQMKGKGVVLAGLIAGAASFLSKKENRDKMMDFINMGKTKKTNGIDEQMEAGNEVGIVSADLAETAAKPEQVDENKFISEGGAQKAINNYNHQQE